MRFSLTHSQILLVRTPSVLSALLDGLPADWIDGDEGPDTWSPFDIVGHLVHGERQDWMVRARMILEQGQSATFATFDRFAQLTESKGKSLEDLLDEFGHLRDRNLATLREMNLTEEQLDLRGRHPRFGPVTLRQLLSTWVVHDLMHLAQIERVMAKQYVDEIGPWLEYLPRLRDGEEGA